MFSADHAERLASYVSQFPSQHIVVLGDAILDEYLIGDCSRISPEAPVPVLKVNSSRRVLGGAANTAANIASMGGKPTLIALVGDDDGGATLRSCAERAGVELCGIDGGGPTLRKTRVVGQHQQIVRLDYEELRELQPSVAASILWTFERCLGRCDIVVISDYAKGFLSRSLANELIDRAHKAGRKVIVDPRPQHREFYVGCDYITPNWRESLGLLGLPDSEPSEEAISLVSQDIARLLGTNVVLTLGPHGIAFCGRDGGEQFAMPTLAREVFDVSGAGDTVVAALALALAAGAAPEIAVRIANQAASVVVGKFGTATVTAAELLQEAEAGRVLSRGALASVAATLRARGRSVVTVNGSFDLLHSGHLHILQEARNQGDVLIVGLNSDSSVRRNKGEERPIVPAERRAEMLLALRVVDYVHIFDESDPIAFLSEVKPDVHVNGAEYGADCIERDAVVRNGGRIHIVGRIPDLSTSDLVAKLRSHPNTSLLI
jgi:D-beta-D-heptose 7-phosphate kinase/D-beta-D-heptose 1-phosphate adenosyltransferase